MTSNDLKKHLTLVCDVECNPFENGCLVEELEARVRQITTDPELALSIGRILCEEKKKSLDAYIDPLTKLPNRLAADEMAIERLEFFREELLKHPEQLNGEIIVAFLDLDGFKQVNDTFGHAAGDEALQMAAERLRECVRSEDLVLRWGGDEFIVFCKVDARNEDSSLITAHSFGQRIVDALTFTYRELPISASVGVVVVDPHAHTIDSERIAGLVKTADFVMYRAKESGKGQAAVDIESTL